MSVNKVVLLGRLCADPEVRHMPSGGQVTNIRLATSRRWKDKQTGERKEESEFHRVVFYQRLAEIAAEYLKKGSQVYIEGRIRTQKWQGQDGQDRYTTEIVVEEMHMLDARAKDGSEPAQGSKPAASGQSAPPPMPPDFDDDIPF